MNIKDNELLVSGIKLAIICAVAALALGIVNAFTEPVIKARAERELKEALSVLVGPDGVVGDEEMPEAITGASADPLSFIRKVYPVFDNSTKEVTSYILQLNGIGYGGDMKILASYALDGILMDVVLMDNAETPGIGKKAEEPGYMDKFIGKAFSGDSKVAIPTRKGSLENPDAVTGATVTFIGVANALSAGSYYVISLGRKQ